MAVILLPVLKCVAQFEVFLYPTLLAHVVPFVQYYWRQSVYYCLLVGKQCHEIKVLVEYKFIAITTYCTLKR